MSADGSAKTPAKARRLGGWRRPVWKDPAWWYAVFCTVVVSGLVWFVFFRNASSVFAWVGLAFCVLVLWAIFSGLIRIYVGVSRAHAEGRIEGERRAEERLRAKKAAEQAKTEQAPAPAPRAPTDSTGTDPAATTGTGDDKLDNAARSAGRFLGRAYAAGRKAAETYRDQP